MRSMASRAVPCTDRLVSHFCVQNILSQFRVQFLMAGEAGCGLTEALHIECAFQLMSGVRTVRLVTDATALLDRLMNIFAVELFFTILMAHKTEIGLFFMQQASKITRVRIVAGDAITGTDRTVQVFMPAAVITMAFTAQGFLRRAPELKLDIRLMRVVATQTVAVKHRLMDRLAGKHLTFVRMATETEGLPCPSQKNLLLRAMRIVTAGTAADPDRAMKKFLLSEPDMARLRTAGRIGF